MRSFTKRALSLVLALVLCIGLLSGISFQTSAATVEYVTGYVNSEYGNVIKNWGTRGTVATFLSPNAEAFYADNNVTYSDLSALSGASDTDSVPSSALYQALNTLVTDNQSKTTSYDDTRYLFQFTDCQGSALTDDSISCFYSGAAIGPDWDSGSTWNREHTWPNSKGDANGQGENDIMMLRPTSSSINSSRGNKAYGTETTTSYYNPNSEAGGQYDLRGDVARTILYVYTRWGTENMWGADGVIESKEVLLTWMEEDPVDTWELGRNDSTESITGTRNVYVDYPELAFCLFNEEVPADMQTPSGEANGTAVSYTVTAVSNNESYGTVSLSGSTITAYPATGYYVAGYSVTDGQAAVTRNGNVFTVTTTADCTVQINFAANNTDDESIQFVSNNVMYEDRMKLMYAVYNPNNEAYTIELTAGTETYGVVQGANVTIGDKECEVYTSEYGVPLQNIDTVITATLSVNGEVKDTLEYSVLEYLHEMQTKLGGGLKTVSTETKKTAMLNMYASVLRSAAKIQNVLTGSSTIDNYGYVYVTNGTINGESGTLLTSDTIITAADLAAENATGWRYQIVGSGDDFAALPEEGLEIGTNNIILTAVIGESGGQPADPVTEILSIFANTGTLASGNESISWTSGDITFTNNKASSSTAIRTTDTDHYRVYKNSAIMIATTSGTISKIVITCTSSSYATALVNSITEGAEATADGSVVTITLATPAASYTIASMSAQVRINTVEVTYTP